jgi:hypothetical protein
MARARASLAISEPEFDEAWQDDVPSGRRFSPRLVAAPESGAESESESESESASASASAAPVREPVAESAVERESAFGGERLSAPGGAAASEAIPRGSAIPGRRTVMIRGQVASRPDRRPRRDPYDRVGSRPDRIAMWAVVLCLLLVLVAATSSHAAVLHLALHAHP